MDAETKLKWQEKVVEGFRLERAAALRRVAELEHEVAKLRGMPLPPIHHCREAQQGDIRIGCTGDWMDADWNQDGMPFQVYRTEEGPLYTFEEIFVTCPECAKGMPKP